MKYLPSAGGILQTINTFLCVKSNGAFLGLPNVLRSSASLISLRDPLRLDYNPAAIWSLVEHSERFFYASKLQASSWKKNNVKG